MTELTQKELEVWAFSRFRNALTDFPDGSVQESESPDFLLSSPSGEVGIELTELIRLTPSGQQLMQEAESLRARVCTKAQRQFEAVGGSYHQVSVYFAPHERLKVQRVAVLADFLCETVASFRLANGETRDLQLDWDTVSQLPAEISSLRAWRPPRDIPCVWQSAEAGFLPACTRDDILRAVERKESRLVEYHKKARTQWLVLVADGFSISRMFEPPDTLSIDSISTSFDRVFYFDNFRRHVLELPTVAPGAAA